MKGGVVDVAHGRYLATRHFASLDGLRCLAIVPVIWHHSTPRPLPGFWGKGPALELARGLRSALDAQKAVRPEGH